MMKVFLSSIENGKSNGKESYEYMLENGIKFKYNLMSYYYIRTSKYDLAVNVRNNSEEILIDSGAHSFQKGKKVNWVDFTKEYADFINCVLYSGISEKVNDWCKIGDLIGVKGRLQTKDNELIVIADKVSFLSSRREENE